MRLNYFLTIFFILIFLASLQASRSSPALAWRYLSDFTETENKEELFDLLLIELFFSADFGFKARDISYSKSGTPLIGDKPLYMAQGEVISTADYLDFAIIGEGFFPVQISPGEYRYTRNGNFKLNTEGWVITEEGFFLYPSLRIDRADFPSLIMSENGKTLQIVRDDLIRDLYDFELYLPIITSEDDVFLENHTGFFIFSSVYKVLEGFSIEHRSLELSTVRVERILARLSDLLFKIEAENSSGDHEFRFYMIDHLLKSQLQMGQTSHSIKRFSDLVKGVAPLLFFDKEKV